MSIAVIIITVVALIYFRKTVKNAAVEAEELVDHAHIEGMVLRAKRRSQLSQELDSLDVIVSSSDLKLKLESKKPNK
jgi:hypothetical protein